jgi:hypothetical protein
VRTLLNEVSDLPGVIGICIFDRKDGVFCGELHDRLTDDLLEKVGTHLVRLLQIGSMSSLGVKTVQFFFDRYAVIGLPLQASSALMAVCGPQADKAAVAAAAVRVAEKLRAEQLPSEIEPEVIAIEEEQIESLEPEPEDSGLYPAQLQAMLCRVEQALAGAVGPVAGMVMQDYIDRWRQNGPAVPARLVELTSMLMEEIGDPEAAQDFIAKIENII